MPNIRPHGFECEVASGASALGEYLYNAEVLQENTAHSYHCSCPYCFYDRPRCAFTWQEDSTADGEFITKILRTQDESDEAIETLAAGMLEVRAEVSSGVGFHVHVSSLDLTHEQRDELKKILFHVQNDIAELASGCEKNVRHYNSPMSDSYSTSRGNWFNFSTGKNTIEFRIWNSTRVAWRMQLAVGISIALVDAAANDVEFIDDDSMSLYDYIGNFMSERTWAFALRQNAYMAGHLS